MFLLRLILIALRGLRTNLFRSLLATLGVIIGVGAVVSAVSILEGAKKGILEQVESLGADKIMVFNGQAERGGRHMALPTLTIDDADVLAREGGEAIRAVAPQYQAGGQVKYFQKNAAVTVLGTSEDYATINNYAVLDGRFITREDIRGSAMVVVLGNKVARDLFGALPPVDKTVKIDGRGFTVVGVMEERGVLGFMDVDNQVTVPISTAMDRMYGAKYLTMLVVQSEGANRVQDCVSRVRQILRGQHRLKAGDPDDFQVFTQQEFQNNLGIVARIFAVVLYSIAGISLVVGGIGIMNIMMVSVTERTREIGVRIAVGARRTDILTQFLIEASTISLFGGAMGVVCGWAIANLLSKVTQVFEVYTPLMAVLVALGVAIGVGIVSGIYPAIRAAQLDPVQALRYE
ncbi:MAG TPA: ABC transporter permease [Phycisphaerae bacterium]|nr:ABC transporter permease [Phycisphaerae bacterium]HNU44081.1 ABC transporter permease [Phycisphaerae bacterium]